MANTKQTPWHFWRIFLALHFAYVLWFLILCLWGFCLCVPMCISQHLYVFLVLFPCLSISLFYFPHSGWGFFLSSSCCCYLDASLCSNEREIKSVNLDGWESGENLRGDGGGSHNQNILYERKFISNLKSRRKMNFKVRTTEKNCLCCLLIVLIKLQHKYYLAPKSRPVP